MFEQWEAVNVFGGALLGGLLEEAAHGNPLHFFKEKCRGFRGLLPRSQPVAAMLY